MINEIGRMLGGWLRVGVPPAVIFAARVLESLVFLILMLENFSGLSFAGGPDFFL